MLALATGCAAEGAAQERDSGAESFDAGGDLGPPSNTLCGDVGLCTPAADACPTPCGGCVIDGTCYGAGQVHPDEACRRCDPRLATDAWSDFDGAPCDDGLFCTVADTCTGGTCAGAAHKCDDGVACNGVESCDEDTDACIAGRTICGAGEICDMVAGACVGSCTGCFVGGLCYGAGRHHPGKPCLICDPARATRAWSAVSDGVACDDGFFCNGDDTPLAADEARGYTVDEELSVRIDVSGPNITVRLAGEPVFAEPAAEDAGHGSGTVGLYSWGNDGAAFHEIVVTEHCH